MLQGKRRKEWSGEGSGLPVAKQHKLQETGSQSHLQETENQSHLQETGSQSHLQETEKQSNLQETEKQSNLQETEKQSNLQETGRRSLLCGADKQSIIQEAQYLLQETGKQTQLHETGKQTQLHETEKQIQLHETGKQTQLQETGKQTQLQETGKQTQLHETGKQTQLQERGKQTQLQETGKQTQLHETGKQTQLQETGKQTQLHETGKQTQLQETGKQTQRQETGKQTQLHETGKQTQLQETGKQTQLQETGKQTQLQETGKQTQLQETGKQTQLQETGKQTQLQETGKQTQRQETWSTHKHKGSHLVSSNSNVTESSSVASTPLVGPQVPSPNRPLTEISPHYLETQDGICLDQNASKGQEKDTKHYIEKDVQQQINIKTATQVDGDTFLNVIESGDTDHAIQILKGNNHFTQAELDRALISSCRHGFKYLIQTLVDLGANVQFKDTHGNTPLLICAEHGFIHIVPFLLKKKADVNAFNYAGDTALILSINEAGSLGMVKVLLEQEGIDIGHQNQDGYTAVMKAVEVRDVDVMKILVERYDKEKADEDSGQGSNPRSLKRIDDINLKGMTAEQIADKHGLGNIFNILKTHVIYQHSPLVVAAKENDIQSLNMLLNCDFVVKQEINDALMKILSSDVKNMTGITENRLLIIKMLLDYGAEVNKSCHFGYVSLLAAVQMGDYDFVEFICQHLDLHQQLQSHCDSQILTAAVTSGRWDIVKLLLNYKTNVDDILNYSDSPLDFALRHGYFESAKLLIEHGAKMDIKIALQSAINEQLPEYMNFIFENFQPEVSNIITKGDIDLNKMLVSAAKGGNLDIIGYFLDAGADVNHETSNAETPLGESKDGDVAKFLINRGANVNLLLQDGDNLLLHILRERNMIDSSNMEVVKVLLENGASVNERGNGGMTPLMTAVLEENNVGVLQILLGHGANVNDQDNKGITSLMNAVCGRPINALFLLDVYRDNKLCVNVQSNLGTTALILAAVFSRPEIVKTLIKLSADVKLKDSEGNTALLNAVRFRVRPWTEEILTTLIKAGSDVNCQNNEGFSPLMLAAKICKIETISILLDSGADVNTVSKMDSTKTALSFLPGWMSHRTGFKRCLQTFLNKGASLSYIDPRFLHNLILRNTTYSISELVQESIVPVDVRSGKVDFRTVSPLCMALVAGNVPLARNFVRNMFLTISDVTSLTENKALRLELEKGQLQDCITFLDELSLQPWSLFQLAFVSVSSAVGSSPGRENRVNMLPLPQVMKDKLLFKSLQVNVPMQDNNYFRELRDVNSSDFSDSDSMDSGGYYNSDGDFEFN